MSEEVAKSLFAMAEGIARCDKVRFVSVSQRLVDSPRWW